MADPMFIPRAKASSDPAPAEDEASPPLSVAERSRLIRLRMLESEAQFAASTRGFERASRRYERQIRKDDAG